MVVTSVDLCAVDLCRTYFAADLLYRFGCYLSAMFVRSLEFVVEAISLVGCALYCMWSPNMVPVLFFLFLVPSILVSDRFWIVS